MSDPRCNGYPCFLYHPTKAPDGKLFNSEEEVNVLGPKWVDSPTKFPKESVFLAWFENTVRPFVENNKLLIGFISVLLVFITAILKLFL